MVKVKEDLTGRTFGRLKVLQQTDDYVSPEGRRWARWKCQCSCPKEKITLVRGCDLKAGNISSCGCLHKENVFRGVKKPNDFFINNGYAILFTTKNEPFFVDVEDLQKVRKYNWYKDDKGYLLSREHGSTRPVELHRLIMDCPDNMVVDHKGGVNTRHDNRKYNLRIVTSSQNNMNLPIRKDNQSGTTGVSWSKKYNKWEARITANKKHHFIGYYDNLDDAINARHRAEEEYFGEFSYSSSQKSYKSNSVK